MTALDDIALERRRQIKQEGWTAEHDDAHSKCEMAIAAAGYALAPSPVEIDRQSSYPPVPDNWPWHWSWWKPGNYRRNLVKAGALIVAEIERWDRLTQQLGKEIQVTTTFKSEGLSSAAIDVLGQLYVSGPTWDGNICSKVGRGELCRAGLAWHEHGCASLTPEGVRTAVEWPIADLVRRYDQRWVKKRRES